jgi:hypothetical protein
MQPTSVIGEKRVLLSGNLLRELHEPWATRQRSELTSANALASAHEFLAPRVCDTPSGKLQSMRFRNSVGLSIEHGPQTIIKHLPAWHLMPGKGSM